MKPFRFRSRFQSSQKQPLVLNRFHLLHPDPDFSDLRPLQRLLDLFQDLPLQRYPRLGATDPSLSVRSELCYHRHIRQYCSRGSQVRSGQFDRICRYFRQSWTSGSICYDYSGHCGLRTEQTNRYPKCFGLRWFHEHLLLGRSLWFCRVIDTLFQETQTHSPIE
jgi:hypothetical protein